MFKPKVGDKVYTVAVSDERWQIMPVEATVEGFPTVCGTKCILLRVPFNGEDQLEFHKLNGGTYFPTMGMAIRDAEEQADEMDRVHGKRQIKVKRPWREWGQKKP